MSLQFIKSVDGKDEYVLLPMPIYHALQHQISERIQKMKSDNAEYVPFELTDYVDNPIALARIRAGMTQAELAKKMKVSQAYISKIEAQDTITTKLLYKIKKVLEK